MPERVTQRRRMGEEALRGVNSCWREKKPALRDRLTVSREKAPANSVPAAAVKRRGQALPGFTGLKGSVGGRLSPS